MPDPLVSFCVPVFNAEERIGRCLDSILIQDIPAEEREILVVDNCSTDRTLSIVEEKLRDVENARIVRNETNIGRIENWNRCLELASGRYIQIVMSSDVLLPGSARGKLRAFEENPELVLVSSPGAALPENGEGYPSFPESPSRRITEPKETLLLFFESGPVTQSLNCVLFRADMIRSLQLRFDKRFPFNADCLFVTHLVSRGPMCFLDGPSCLFDASNKQRYYFVGISDAGRYFIEHGAFVRLVASYLRKRQVRVRYSKTYLIKRYEQWIGSGARLSFLATVKTFAPSSLLILYALTIRAYSLVATRAPMIAEIYRILKRGTLNVLRFPKALR